MGENKYKPVIPAQAGTHFDASRWIAAFAAMTVMILSYAKFPKTLLELLFYANSFASVFIMQCTIIDHGFATTWITDYD